MSQLALDRLGIPPEHQEKVSPDAPLNTRLAVAKGLLPLAPEVLVNLAFVLIGDADRKVSRAAMKTLKTMPEDTLVRCVTQLTHPRLLDLLSVQRPEDEALMEAIYKVTNAEDGTCLRIAEAAEGNLFEAVLRNQERLLITPPIYLALLRNPRVTPADRDRVASFLKLHRCLPTVPPELGGPKAAAGVAAASEEEEPERELSEAEAEAIEAALMAPPPKDAPPRPKTKRAPPPVMDEATTLRLAVEAEVEAALAGLPSPMSNPEVAEALKLSREKRQALGELGGGFAVDLGKDAWGFPLELIKDKDETSAEEQLTLVEQIKAMSPGKKIKLAYLGNAEARKILLRDSNKVVVIAVVRSKRMSDNELLSAAGNRNLPREVFREISMDKEAIRKYPIKLALANNPRVPVNISIGLLKDLTKADLAKIAKNKNVSSVLSGLALKKMKE
ncbi:MAG: hypothetical protein IPO67_17220 [Deltaproteobacteria bacterium]|nr:hypothetical protein [Deltaproteobacteria bacterium]